MVNELISRLFKWCRSHPWALLIAVAVAVVIAVILCELKILCPKPEGAPVLNEEARNRIPDQYIVAFKPGTDRETVAAAQRTVKRLGGTIRYSTTSEPIWFSAKMPADAVEAMRATPGVAYIEADQRGAGSTVQPPNPDFIPPDGLDRTSERFLPLDDRFTYSENGTDVHVYVLDTGIEISHTEFAGRVSGPHVNCLPPGVDCEPEADPICHGHGTHIAGIIGGTKYGIAKKVFLHSVRVLDCSNGAPSTDVVAAGVAWVKNNAIPPAVANMSLNFPDSENSPRTLSDEVAATIDAGVTVVISAGNYGDDAAAHWPGGNLTDLGMPGPIIVGAVDGGVSDPLQDIRWANSSYGSSVDLFAPGFEILSAWKNQVPPAPATNTETNMQSGTSQAAAHVSGVAALYLDSSNATLVKTPAEVKYRIVNDVADIYGMTTGWAGVKEPDGMTASTPNTLLHWGSLDDGYTDGDPHIKTVNGVHYDFQGAGEYVLLRDQDGTEIQTRQTAIATTFNPPTNPYTGLATCMSLNTAVAARVGQHRVSYQPNINGIPDPSGLQLRVDGDLIELGPDGLELGSGGRVVNTVTGGIEIHFPYETILTVTPGWWASQSKWYLNVGILRTRSKEGLIGAIGPQSWLPALPDGTSLGPKPAALHERYLELYHTFGNAWRVTDKTSLFDYAPGTSTATFTLQSWPPENPPCVIAGTEPVKPTTPPLAEEACRKITEKNRHANCVFDVTVTGNPGFADTYLLSQRIRDGSTTITLAGDQDTTQVGEWVTFTAIVAPGVSANNRVPTGAVQFSLDGSKVGEPVKLDSKGRATWETSRLKVRTHRVAASYIPSKGSVFLASTSLERIHTVKRCYCEHGGE